MSCVRAGTTGGGKFLWCSIGHTGRHMEREGAGGSHARATGPRNVPDRLATSVQTGATHEPSASHRHVPLVSRTYPYI
ncbi:unnamed protein product, partial [Brenthis ino]